MLFLWLLSLLIVTLADTMVNKPSPYAKGLCSGNQQKIPFDPRLIRCDTNCHRPANLMTSSDNGSQRFLMDNFHFSQKHTQGHATFEYLHKHIIQRIVWDDDQWFNLVSSAKHKNSTSSGDFGRSTRREERGLPQILAFPVIGVK